jgi:hypothetical protein
MGSDGATSCLEQTVTHKYPQGFVDQSDLRLCDVFESFLPPSHCSLA